MREEEVHGKERTEHVRPYDTERQRKALEKLLGRLGGEHTSGEMQAGDMLEGYQAVAQAPVGTLGGGRQRYITVPGREHQALVTGSWSDPWWMAGPGGKVAVSRRWKHAAQTGFDYSAERRGETFDIPAADERVLTPVDATGNPLEPGESAGFRRVSVFPMERHAISDAEAKAKGTGNKHYLTQDDATGHWKVSDDRPIWRDYRSVDKDGQWYRSGGSSLPDVPLEERPGEPEPKPAEPTAPEPAPLDKTPLPEMTEQDRQEALARGAKRSAELLPPKPGATPLADRPQPVEREWEKVAREQAKVRMEAGIANARSQRRNEAQAQAQRTWLSETTGLSSNAIHPAILGPDTDWEAMQAAQRMLLEGRFTAADHALAAERERLKAAGKPRIASRVEKARLKVLKAVTGWKPTIPPLAGVGPKLADGSLYVVDHKGRDYAVKFEDGMVTVKNEHGVQGAEAGPDGATQTARELAGKLAGEEPRPDMPVIPVKPPRVPQPGDRVKQHAAWMKMAGWHDSVDHSTGYERSSIGLPGDFSAYVQERSGRYQGKRKVEGNYDWHISRQRTDREGPDARGSHWELHIEEGHADTLAKAKSQALAALKRRRAAHIASGGDVGYGDAPTGDEIRAAGLAKVPALRGGETPEPPAPGLRADELSSVWAWAHGRQPNLATKRRWRESGPTQAERESDWYREGLAKKAAGVSLTAGALERVVAAAERRAG